MKLDKYPEPNKMPFCSCGNQMISFPPHLQKIVCENCNIAVWFDHDMWELNHIYFVSNGKTISIYSDVIYVNGNPHFISLFNIKNDIDPKTIAEKAIKLLVLI